MPDGEAMDQPPTVPPATALPAPTPTLLNPQHVIEQYKAKLSDLGNLGTRQTAMTTYYVSILTALLGVLAFKETRTLAAIEPAIILAICIPGVLVSLLWFTAVSFFRNLFRAKLAVLEEMETGLPYQTFSKEFAQMKTTGRSSWLAVERYVPIVFGLVFAGILVARFDLVARTRTWLGFSPASAKFHIPYAQAGESRELRQPAPGRLHEQVGT
jgi:hypothetical protein